MAASPSFGEVVRCWSRPVRNRQRRPVNGSFRLAWETIGCHGKQDADILRGVDEPRLGDLYDALVALAITVRLVRTEELDGVTGASVIEVCVAAHHNEDFQALFSYVPSGGRHFLGYRGDELVSHAMVTTRWLQPDGLPLLKTAYVDAVATHPAHEGLGYGSAVMRQLASDIDADFVIGCLETARVTFYERLGWELWRGPLAGRRRDGLVPTPEQTGVMVLRLSTTPTLDLDAPLTIECQPTRIW
jgi:aminoglycoside 2'-N-acetyltransferase I